jgi:hypothetical protein
MIVFLGVVVVMLKFGPRLCRARHTAKPTEFDWQDKTYEQKVSYAWSLCLLNIRTDTSFFRSFVWFFRSSAKTGILILDLIIESKYIIITM